VKHNSGKRLPDLGDKTVARVNAEIHRLELKAAEGDKDARIELLTRVLMGFATNSTQCLACQMSNSSARKALARDARLSLGEC
jgi:hypothetical protein